MVSSKGVGVFSVGIHCRAPQRATRRTLEDFWIFPFRRRDVESINQRCLDYGRAAIVSPKKMFQPKVEGSMTVPWLRLF